MDDDSVFGGSALGVVSPPGVEVAVAILGVAVGAAAVAVNGGSEGSGVKPGWQTGCRRAVG
jgi:hypothetical protein